MVRLAGPQLRSLSCTASAQTEPNGITMPHLATLTALTKLELACVLGPPQPAELHSLRQLRLLELRLVNCGRLASSLIVPGALSTLRKLHLEDFMMCLLELAEIAAERGAQCVAPEVHEFGRVLLALPDLVEVSGHCGLFVLKILEGCRGWRCLTKEVPGLPVAIRGTVWRKFS